MFCAVRPALACRATHCWSGHDEGERVSDEIVGDERVGDERVGDKRVGDEGACVCYERVYGMLHVWNMVCM